ncbi:5772_t:CDS:2 [Ambispora gerdemannii]|uniref:5772_t:CDS:1 n=1 Tax=Ambispora gerdemannii TaxID=144530 RepID=A0A9N9FZU8_9GLOM|nr:5772_t:CDS:2 [Ambispora gerdemannii]
MTKKRGSKTNNATTGEGEISSSGSLTFKNQLGKFDSISGDYFALVTPGVDRHRLRVFDRITGIVKNDFSSEKEYKFTCLTWGEISSGEEINDESELSSSSKPNKNEKPYISKKFKVIALGLQNGSIVIYSLSHDKIISNLKGAHTSQINDFVFTRDGKRGFSCSDDLLIVEWNIEERNVVSKWKADSKVTKKLALSHNQSRLITTGYTIKLWDLNSKKVIRNYTGHTSLINNIIFMASDNMCISAAEDDRFINVWDCQGNIEGGVNLAALVIDSNITSISISSKDILFVISEDGIMYLFDIKTLKNLSSLSSKKKKHLDDRSPKCVIKVLSEGKGETIPILGAFFIEKEEDKFPSIVIARGSTVKPIFDIVDLDKERNNKKSLPPEINLMRPPQTGFLLGESNLAAANLKVTQKQYDESNTNVLGSSNVGLPKLSLAIELDETPPNKKPDNPVSVGSINNITLAQSRFNKPTKISNSSEFTIVDANSLQNVLMQALHSDDTIVLNRILYTTKPEVMKNTVKKLPVEYVIPLIEKIVENFQTKQNPEMGILTWMSQILLEHTAYLMTVPDLVRKLSNFYQVLETRLQGFNKLLSFHGRLEMVMQQISMRQRYAAERFSDSDIANSAKTIYVESEDDDDNDQNMEAYENEGRTKRD